MPKLIQRHFPYKHPSFGTNAKPKSVRAWQDSVYYWWWAYLRRNQAYLATCSAGGGGALASLYSDFGDVRSDDFKRWWIAHGVSLFADPVAKDTVRVVASVSQLTLDDSTLVISIPLGLPKRVLQKRLLELLSKHHKGRRGHQLAKQTRARYKVRGQPNIPALRLGLAVYDHRLANPEMPLWQVGNTLPKFQLARRIATGELHAADRKNVLAATVSRYLKRVRLSIESAGQGQFP